MNIEERLTLCIVETRKIICFLRPKQKPNHEYAILTRAFDATVDQCCTCLNQNDHLQTYSYKDIELAMKRLHNKNDYCPLKTNTPTAQLHRLLLHRMLTMTPSLEENVAAMELKFQYEAEEAAAKMPVRVSKKKKLELQDGHASSRITTQVYEMGTMVRRFFERRELPKWHNTADGLLGVFVNGCIVDLRVNGSQKLYKILYHPPISDFRWSNGEEACRFRATYTCTAAYTLPLPPLSVHENSNDAPLDKHVYEDEAKSDIMDRRSEADKNLTVKTVQLDDQAKRLVQEMLDELWREHELAANGVAIDATIAHDLAVLMVQDEEKALDDNIEAGSKVQPPRAAPAIDTTKKRVSFKLKKKITGQQDDQAKRLVQEMLDELRREHDLAANGVAIDATIAHDLAVLMVQDEEKALDDNIEAGAKVQPPRTKKKLSFKLKKKKKSQQTATLTHSIFNTVLMVPPPPNVSPTHVHGIESDEYNDVSKWIEQGTAISLVPVPPLPKKRRVAVGKKKMSEKVKQRIQHRKEKQRAAKKRQILPDIAEGGTENNEAISLAPTSLLGKKRKLNRLIRIGKKRRKHLREEAKQRKSESAQEWMEGQNEDHDVEQSDWRWDVVSETWMYEPLQEKTKLKRKKNLTNKSLKNRILAMRRTWNTPKKDEMIAKISINRIDLHTVR
jgi:hypothetical protein